MGNDGEAVERTCCRAASASSVVGTSTATCLPNCDRLERGADRDLGLAEAHIAAQQAVHRTLAAEIALDLLGGLGLIRRVLVGEGRDELVRDRLFAREGHALATCAIDLDLQQVGGHVAQRLRHVGLASREALAAELVELGFVLTTGADVFLDQIDLGDRDEHFGLSCEGQAQVVFFGILMAARRALDAHEFGDAVHRMHDEVPDGKLEEAVDRAARDPVLRFALHRATSSDAGAEELAVVEDEDLELGDAKAAGQAAYCNVQRRFAAAVALACDTQETLGFRLGA
jgi:hypothetical protein